MTVPSAPPALTSRKRAFSQLRASPDPNLRECAASKRGRAPLCAGGAPPVEAADGGAGAHARKRHGAERDGDGIERALELLKELRESGEAGRQEREFQVPSIGVITVFFHRGAKPLKGISVNNEASFTTFSKFRDWIGLRQNGRLPVGRDAHAHAPGSPEADGCEPGADGAPFSHECSGLADYAMPTAVHDAASESTVRGGALRTPSPCSVAALVPPDAEQSSDRCTGITVNLSELFDASAALMLLGRHAPR
ncbi:hypothetical protein KFE25_002877 [Diacronema lutheri]|uniref:Uncharacterized protein n=1 Tax=Diacronema lutheri TaxID=2081491 RepID=A0A7R9UJX6_DIALT|nr:hypothetical protein KFE25_002877 [Diacronema lutheri]|mmetsp:Transcript_1395/g.4589  ORF Transcript_1395/g.4589 Transcript_1395/m.4589 type:complete len:252 (+) Transcript_1395:23-778(+)